MIGQTEFAGAKPPVQPLVKDWSRFSADIVSPQLPKNIKYTAPRPNEALRKRVAEKEPTLNEENKTMLRICLSFLEAGTMVDDFGNDDDARDKFLLANTVTLGKESMTLYALAKATSKLSGNAITRVITASQLSNDPLLSTRGNETATQVHTIKNGRGYFIPEDLTKIDDLALGVVDHILK